MSEPNISQQICNHTDVVLLAEQVYFMQAHIMYRTARNFQGGIFSYFSVNLDDHEIKFPQI